MSQPARGSIRSAFITGVSSGIGRELARRYLELGWAVYGTSRRDPGELTPSGHWHFLSSDLANLVSIPPALDTLLAGVRRIDVAILNAGIIGKFGDIADTPLHLIKQVMDVNTWSNKVILDYLLLGEITVVQVIAISTGASKSGNRGWNAYSISKAALNMLVRLYSREFPDTHFCALAPGLVDTGMQDYIRTLASDDRYPTIDRMKNARGTPDMQDPDQAAGKLIDIIGRLPGAVQSGDFADARDMS